MTDAAEFWWISYAADQRFLGGTLVLARTPVQALVAARQGGLNPGGHAAIVGLNTANEKDLLPYVPGRLYTKEQLVELGPIERLADLVDAGDAAALEDDDDSDDAAGAEEGM